MKKFFALLAGALPLVVVLSGCAQIGEAIGNVTGNHSYSKNLTVDGKVDTADGSYSSVRVSDEFMNKTVNGGTPTGKPFIDIVNSETGQKMSSQPSAIRERITRYFFDEFIDSTALEGGKPTLEAWSKQKLGDGTLTPTAFTKNWLKQRGASPVLTITNMLKSGPQKLIHDGGPRMSDAKVTFGKTTWTKNDDGALIKTVTDWSVDYRITDQTVAALLKAQNKISDDEVKKYLTAEAQDGSGENKLHVFGTAEWYQVDHGDSRTDPFYLISAPLKYSLESVIKPEFHTKAPAPSKKP